MEKNRRSDLLQTVGDRAVAFSLFASLFCDLPSQETVAENRRALCSLAGGKGFFSGDAKGGLYLIDRYFAAQESVSLQDIVTELLVDRTRLLRGCTTGGPKPPYESVHLNRAPQETIGELQELYTRAGLGLVKNAPESPEYLGVEFCFVAELCSREKKLLLRGCEEEACSLLEVEETFFAEHLRPFALSVSQDMAKHARTGFYRGVAALMKDFVCELACFYRLPVAFAADAAYA